MLRHVLPAILLLVFCGNIARADSAPEEVLKSKGLAKQGTFYALDTDLKLADSLRALHKAEALLDVYARKCKAIQKDIDRASEAVNQFLRDRTALEAKLSHTPSSNINQYNDVVAQINQKNVNIHDALEYQKKRQGDLAKLSAPTDQIQLTMDLATKMDAAAAEYDELAKDAEVTAALAKLNETGTLKFRLGPMAQFKTELPKIRAKRDAIDASALKLDTSSAEFGRVTVMLNDKERVTMVLDSGAGLVSITADVAKEIGLEPGPDAPTATMTIADGSHVKAIIATIARIQLGKFIAENVECAILPASIKHADCLLGGSFLRNFIYQIDLANGELHLSPITAIVDPKAPSPPPTKSLSPRDPPKSKPATSAPSASKTETEADTITIEIAASIDGSDSIDISAIGMNWTHSTARWPTSVTVNGDAWDPHVQHLLAAHDKLAFLNDVDFSTAKIVEKTGRGEVTIEPHDDNVHIHIADNGRGADRYQIKIELAKKPQSH